MRKYLRLATPDERLSSYPIYRTGQTPRTVLFVCRGNIIRSPMAAALLKQFLTGLDVNNITILSAGLHARNGQAVADYAQAAARRFGISLDLHRAQRLTIERVLEADVIFVMDTVLEGELLAHYPQAKNKVFLLNTCTKENGPAPVEITDPYGGDENDIFRCYELLQRSIRCLTFLPQG